MTPDSLTLTHPNPREMKTNMLTSWLVSLGRKCDRGKDPEVTKWTTVQDHRKKQTPEKQQISFHFSHSCKDLANFEPRVVSTLDFSQLHSEIVQERSETRIGRGRSVRSLVQMQGE
jgi:hypothetical protein